jgi:ribosomal-protein-alanine N-acetyltransferase
MVLETARLTLRSVEARDRDLLVALRVDPDVRRYLGGPMSLDDAGSVAELNIAHPEGKLIAERRDNREAIGLVLLHEGHGATEISYQFGPSSWSQGFATEAVRCVLAHALESAGISELIAVTQAANEGSRRLLERLGLQAAEQFEEFGEQQMLYRTVRVAP